MLPKKKQMVCFQSLSNKVQRKTLLREVFRIGGGWYSKLLHNISDKVGGGRNGNAVSEDKLEQLYRFTMKGVPTELGYPALWTSSAAQILYRS